MGETYNCPAQDIDGESRPLNANADIGADERDVMPGIFDQGLSNGNSMSIAPNPVKDKALIKINLKTGCFASLRLYDIHGRMIQVLIDDHLYAGNHEFTVEFSGLRNGIYFCVLVTNSQVEVMKSKIIKL